MLELTHFEEREIQKKILIHLLGNYSSFFETTGVLRNPVFVIDKADLDKALDTLQDSERKAVEYHYIKGFTVREVGSLLDIPKSTLSDLLMKAIEKLVDFCEEKD